MTESVATFRSMRHRNFRLFFFGQFTSQVGNWLTLVAQSLFVLELRGKGLAVGIIAACQFLPMLLLGAYGGVVADRADKRKLLMGVQTLAMAQSFGLAFVASRPHPSFFWLCLVASLGGITMAFDNPSRRAFFVELVDVEDVNNAVGLNSSLMTSSRIVGPLLAGILISTAGYPWCFAVDAFTYLAVLGALAMMNVDEIRAAPVVERASGQIRAGFAYVRSMPELWVSLVVMAVVGTLAFNFQVVLPVLVVKTFHHDKRVFTWLFSVLSAGSLAGALYAAKRVNIGLRDVARSSAAFGLALCALALTPWLWLSFPVSLIVGWTSISFLTASTSIVQLRADPAMRGRVLALQAVVFLGTTPIGGPIVGAICDGWGARSGLWVGGIASILAGGFGLVHANCSAPSKDLG